MLFYFISNNGLFREVLTLSINDNTRPPPPIKELLDNYKPPAELDDGAHIEPKSQRTAILGTVAANQGPKCNQLSLPPPETQQDSSEISLTHGIEKDVPGDPGAIV